MQLQEKYISNMAKNIAAHEKKVKHAVSVLLENPRLKIHQAMLVALFEKKDLNAVNIWRVISQRRDLAVKALLPPINVRCGNPPLLMDLLTEGDVTESTVPSTTTDSTPPPKQKKQKLISLALQHKQVEDLKQNKHRSDALKEAVGVYLQEI